MKLSSIVAKILIFGCLPALIFTAPTRNAAAVDFVHEVVPVLKRNCVHCHGGREAEGDFSLNTRAMVVDSGFVEVGEADYSHLIDLITSTDPDEQMPPSDRPRMNANEIAVIRKWIDEGMNWDDDFTFAIDVYEPPLRPRKVDLPPTIDGRSNPVDRILDSYLARRKIDRPAIVDDATFLRRVSLDLVGLLPTPEQLDEFRADSDPQKRSRVIDELLADQIGYADHWMTFFNDLLRNDYSGTGFITGGRSQISTWLYDALIRNQPFDQMARELIAPPSQTSQGYMDGIKWRGEVSAGQTLPIQFSQSISQSFLGINMKCASCHDSFIDRWKLKDAYGLAAIYSDEKLELHRCDKPTGETATAAWLFPELGQVDASAPREQRLQQLADLMTDPENGRFARTIVNRLWYQMLGRGIVHPLDAMQSQPWNEDLLDYLAVDLVDNGYDLKATLRGIANSAAYQSESEVVDESAVGDEYIYRGPRTRRMTAEQFIDNIWQLTGDAPDKVDAPVRRLVNLTESSADVTTEPTADWIWGPLENGSVPGGQSIMLRKTFNIPQKVTAGRVVLTCDNEFQMYLNDQWVGRGDNWENPQSLDWSKKLVPGENTIIVIATNGTTQPNPAGFYLEGQIKLADESVLTIRSDASWQFNPNVPADHAERLPAITGDWANVTIVPALPVWTNVILEKAAPMLTGEIMPTVMVRASLIKNSALLKSLGRPTREQIVSMRPDTITTLEAIDMANEPSLAASFAAGAKRMIAIHQGQTDPIIIDLFESTLSRKPTPREHQLMRGLLGEAPNVETVQDAIWAVCMLPEFILIR